MRISPPLKTVPHKHTVYSWLKEWYSNDIFLWANLVVSVSQVPSTKSLWDFFIEYWNIAKKKKKVLRQTQVYYALLHYFVQQDNLGTPLFWLKSLEVKGYWAINIYQMQYFTNIKKQHATCLRKIADTLGWPLPRAANHEMSTVYDIEMSVNNHLSFSRKFRLLHL